MSIFDVILLISMSGFVFYGLFFGFIRTFGSLLGIIIGMLYTFETYETVYAWVNDLFFGYHNIGKFIVFILLFTLVNRLIGFAFSLLDKTFNIISIIPFLKTINRIGGAILGLLMGILVVGLTLMFIVNFTGHWLVRWTDNSQLTPFLFKTSKILLSILPSVINFMKNWINGFGY